MNPEDSQTVRNQLVNAMALRINAWTEMVVLTVQPISFFENEVIRRVLSVGNIFVDALQNYLGFLTSRV